MDRHAANNFTDRMRSLEEDHEPDGWPAVRMRDISALLDIIDDLRADNDIHRRRLIQLDYDIHRYRAALERIVSDEPGLRRAMAQDALDAKDAQLPK